MPTPIELLNAAQAKLLASQSDLSAANAKIADANVLIDQAKAGIVTPPPNPTLYTLIVVSGSGSGNYQAGDVVPVVALASGSGRVFNGWTGPVADPSKPSTSVTMPANSVQVEATYKTVTPPTPGTRITSLVHLGQFNVPIVGNTDASGYSYGGRALSFCAAHQSLFLGGMDVACRVGEISIPAFGATAKSIQAPADPFGGKLSEINPGDPNQKFVGGTFVDGDMLVVSAYSNYDGGSTQRLSHFRRPLLLSSAPATVIGPYQVGPLNAGFYSGYMSDVPSDWRQKFKGRAFTGNACLAITGRTSLGPSTAAFDPASGQQTAIELVGYPDTHATLGKWDANPPGQYYGGSDQVKGVAMPIGFSTVLFVGSHGTTFCYGTGSACGDPTDSSKGVHGYPYRAVAWLYDADDLAQVAAGTKAPWDVKPYAMIDLPGANPNHRIGGCAYDPATGRLYVSELNAAPGVMPVIHVYEVH